MTGAEGVVVQEGRLRSIMEQEGCIHVPMCVYNVHSICENPSYKNIQRSSRDAAEGLRYLSSWSSSRRGRHRWRAPGHRQGSCSREDPKSQRSKRHWPCDRKMSLPPPLPQFLRHLTLSLQFLELLTQNLKQGEEEGKEKQKPHNYSCADISQKSGILQKLDRLGVGLGEGDREFLRPEKRGKHITELDESFIRL